MSANKEIWSSDTGILDLPHNWQTLKVPELVSVRDAWQLERERLHEANRLTQFTEQMNREWAIETGILENLYDIERGVTQTLIEQGFQAALLETGTTNKPRDWVIQLLNDQQEALEGLFAFVKEARPLSTSYIKQLHSALLRHQNSVEAVDAFGQTTKFSLVRGDWKKQPNYPTRDGVIFRYCPPEQVASEMDRLIAMHHTHHAIGVPAEIEAAWLHHRFSQIHPFQDGNGRVARTLASLVFIQNHLFPLVVTRDDKGVYLDALEEADNGNLASLIALFAKLQRVRFRMAASTAETAQRAGVAQALQSLRASIEKKQEEQTAQLQRVFEFAHSLEARTLARMEDIARDLQELFRQLEPSSYAITDRSESETAHYFRGQIVEIARDYLNYHANPAPYKSWVRLKMKWTRRARIVFTFHAIGYEFSGVLVCTPFLEFQDEEDTEDDSNGLQRTLRNIALEPFEFYYDELLANIERRYDIWLESVLTIALAELQRNL